MVLEKIFYSFAIASYGNSSASGGGQFGPQGLDWQDLCRGPLDIAKYQIYKLWASWFQRRFLKFFPLLVYGSYMLPRQQEFQSNQPKNLMQPFPKPGDALHKI